MDLASGIASVFAAVGLSGAAGFNAYLPLLLSAVLDRLDVVDLGEPFGALSSDAGIAILAALFVADFVGDKVPGVRPRPPHRRNGGAPGRGGPAVRRPDRR